MNSQDTLKLLLTHYGLPPFRNPGGGMREHINRLDDKAKMATHHYQQGVRLRMHVLHIGGHDLIRHLEKNPKKPYFWLGEAAERNYR